MTQIDASKNKGPKARRLMLVRYGKMGLLGWIEHNEPEVPKVPTKVVIKTKPRSGTGRGGRVVLLPVGSV